jgi:chromosome segregation ATPase
VEPQGDSERVIGDDDLTIAERAQAAALEAQLAEIRKVQEQRGRERARLAELETRMMDIRATQAEVETEMAQLRASQAGSSRLVKQEPRSGTSRDTPYGDIIDLTDD